jgi:hypothetical protein
MSEETKKEESKSEAFEEVKGKGHEALESIKNLIKQGNIRRVVIKNKDKVTIAEFPLTFGVIGVVAAPVIASIGAIIALVSECSIYVEKK